MGCPVCGACYGCPGGLERLHWSGGLLCRKKEQSPGAMMRSNVPLHARKKLPAGEPVLRWYGVTTRSARADVSPEAARRPGAAPGIGGIPGRVTKQTPAARRRETPLHAVAARYTNNNLRHQPAHVLVVDLLEHLAAI